MKAYSSLGSTINLFCDLEPLFTFTYTPSFHIYKGDIELKLDISNWLPTGHIWCVDIILFGSYSILFYFFFKSSKFPK